MSAVLEAHGFKRRVHRQRFDKDHVPAFAFAAKDDSDNVVAVFNFRTDDVRTIGKFKVLGQEMGKDHHGAPCLYDMIVFEPQGTRLQVPCYRRHDPASNYAICQNYTYKAFER